MQFIGNAKAVHVLERSLEKQCVAQTYLFVGPDHVGKCTLALAFARSLAGDAPFNIAAEGEISQGDFNIIILRPEREEQRGVVKEKAIAVEHIRNAQQQLATFPSGGKKKVLIVDGADHVTVSAQNALLKTLEEPNSTTVAILVASNRSKILSTIQSRCQQIHFSLVSDVELGIWKDQQGRDASAEHVRGAQGRPGLLVAMLQDSVSLERWKDGSALLRSVVASGVNSRLDIAERLAQNIPETVALLKEWVWLLREEKKNVSETYARIAIVVEGIQLLEETNTNSRLVLENVLLAIT